MKKRKLNDLKSKELYFYYLGIALALIFVIVFYYFFKEELL